jgi:hypothetical protein
MADEQPGATDSQNFDVSFDEGGAQDPTGSGQDPTAGAQDPTGDIAGIDPHSGTYDPEVDGKDVTGGNAEVIEWLPEEFKEDPDFAEFKTQEDLIKAFKTQKASMAALSKIPTEESSQEDWDKFYEALGRPKTAEEYKLDKELPEGLTFNEDMFNGFTGEAHKLGLSQKQVEGIYSFYNNKTLEITKTIDDQVKAVYQKSVDDAVGALKKEWGTDYEDNLKAAVAIGNKFLSPETKKYLNASKLGNNPLLIKDFYKLSQQVSGAQMKGGDAPKITSTVAELEAKMEKNLRAPDYTTNTLLQNENKQIANQIIAIKAKSQG